MPPFRTKNFALLAAFAGLTAGVWACSIDGTQTPIGPAGSSGTATVGGGGSTAQAGTATAQAGTSSAGMTSGGAGTAGTPATGGTGGASGGNAGAAGSSGSGGSAVGGGSGKTPTCVTNAVADGVDRSTNNYIECDVEDQAIDFDVMAAYPQPRKPGYDPTTTPVSFTDFGTALTGSAVQECHPYCYKGNLTIGLELAPGADTSMRGEVLFAFPPTVAPIVAPTGRASLGWIWLDGPALPAGAKLTAQMVLKSTDKGVVVAKDSKDVTPQKWFEFRYFPIDEGFDKANLVNITHIGFRVTLTGATAAYQGVMYADHFQLRK
jgi:hypothetical protein